MRLKSESTGNNYKKVENMCNDFSDDTGDFSKLNKMQKNDTEDSSGTYLVNSLNVFSTWMLIQPKKVLYVQKKLCWSPEFMLETI